MSLRWPLSRDSQFSVSFLTWDDGKTEDHAKVSTPPIFKGSSINNDELRDNLIRTKCMAMQTWLETKRQDYESRDIYGTELLANFIFCKK